MSSAEISIPRRYNGPLDSGNGGYCAGVFAALADEPAAVNLRRPVPLEVQLDLIEVGGGELHVKGGDELIAEVQPTPPPALEVPGPVGRDGRKHCAGSAVVSAGGEVLAVAEALMIEPRA